MEKSIIVVGAGVAGLSAGCYSQMNGFNTQIFEMHNLPGGVCTTWRRKGYSIDGCIHWLTGSNPNNEFYSLWEELGVVQNWSIIDHEEYSRVEGDDGKVLIIYSDIDRLEKHMIKLAPEDEDVIKEFTNGIRDCIGFPLPVEKAPELWSPIDKLKIMFRMRPYFKLWKKWGKVTIKDFTPHFKNPFLREAFPYIFNLQNPTEFPILVVLMTLAWMHQKTAGYPIGGSLELAKTIEDRFLNLGGKIHYKSRVAKILVEDDKAKGIQLEDGSKHHSDFVISAADGHSTIFDMLGGKYINQKIKGYYDNMPVYSPILYVGLGIDNSFEEIQPNVTGIDFPLEVPITIGGKKRNRLSVQIYNFDPTLAPKGKTFIRVMYASDYEYWKKLYQKPVSYKKEKEEIADLVVSSLEQRFPGITKQVEMKDVATPMTFVRYTGNWKGSFQGWRESIKTLRMRMEKTLPGLDNFYMAGQWVQPGGSIPTAVMSGRHVIQIICKKNQKEFKTIK